LEGRFFEGQAELLKKARPYMELVAAFGARPLVKDGPAPFPPVSMTHIWKMVGKDRKDPGWGSLYTVMSKFSENDWYVREVESLQGESQDLLVLAAPGIVRTPRPGSWAEPYIYVYEELRLRGKSSRTFLKDLNWFASQDRSQCELMWLCNEVTGTPSQWALLWRSPSIDAHRSFLAKMTYDEPYATRYASSMLGLESFSREYMFPESTEVIDNLLHP